MIVGNGLIANAFEDCEDCVIFASGVSDSNETDRREFNREFDLLRRTITANQDKKMIYFTSVLSGSKSKYYDHKNRMESVIHSYANEYIIYRIPQMIGKLGNQSNLVHVLRDKIMNGEEIKVFYGIDRALFDVCDLVDFVNYSKDYVSRGFVNISYIEKLSVFEIVRLISTVIEKSAKCKVVNGNGPLENWSLINSPLLIDWININDIQTNGYTEKVLRKYL